MWRFFLAFLTITSCFSCNSKKESSSGDNSSLPSGEKELRDKVSQYPDSLPLRTKLVDYFANNQDYENAIKETNVALQKDSTNAEWWDVKARLVFLNGDTVGAINAYQKAIAIFPNPEYVIALGTLYAQTRNPLALAMADALLQAPLANAQLQAHFIKGLYFNYAGEKLKSITFFEKCISLDYNFMDAYREKAIALYDLAKYEQSLQVLEQATTVKRSYDEAWYWMGKCYQMLDKKTEAVASYRVALQIDPDFMEAKDALAKLGVTP